MNFSYFSNFPQSFWYKFQSATPAGSSPSSDSPTRASDQCSSKHFLFWCKPSKSSCRWCLDISWYFHSNSFAETSKFLHKSCRSNKNKSESVAMTTNGNCWAGVTCCRRRKAGNLKRGRLEVKHSSGIITYFYIFFICFIHHFSSFCFYNNNQLFSSSLHIFCA